MIRFAWIVCNYRHTFHMRLSQDRKAVDMFCMDSINMNKPSARGSLPYGFKPEIGLIFWHDESMKLVSGLTISILD